MEERLKKTIARRVKNGCFASLAAEVIMPSGTVRVVTRACAVDGGLLPPSGGPKIAKGAVEPSVLVRSGRAGTHNLGCGIIAVGGVRRVTFKITVNSRSIIIEFILVSTVI